MGRASGSRHAAGTSGFDAVLGARRGSSAGALLESGAQPSDAGRLLLATHAAQLDAGNLDGTVGVLRANLGELATAPRLRDLRALLAGRLGEEAADTDRERLATALATFGFDPQLSAKETVTLSKAVQGEVERSLGRTPRAGSDGPGGAPTVAAMLRGQARTGYRIGAKAVLTARALADPERAIACALGEEAYRRLGQEAAGVWGDEWPLQDLFGDGLLDGQPHDKETRPLAPVLERKHWREFMRGVTYDFAEGEHLWADGVCYGKLTRTPGVRGETRYQLARLLRKRIRAQYGQRGATPVTD